jgi:predicted acyltransferase
MQAVAVSELPRVSPPAAKPATGRYLALDAYRGFIMILLVANAFGLRALKDHPGFAWIANQFEHVPWEGAVFYDLIQPAFMFMVGVAMPFALARRMEQGATFGQNFRHVLVRALKLILLSQILISISGNKLTFQLINVLSQIAFTYLVAFLIMQLPWKAQAAGAVALLAGHWALFALFPGPEGAFSQSGNIGQVIDQALLGYNYSGRYVTINFISSAVTTLFGVWTGNLLRSGLTQAAKMKTLALAMVLCFASGLALSLWNPLVKRIWTASFTLYSTGWVLLMLLGFFFLADVLRWRKPLFPLVVVGMNSIFIYSVSQVLQGWINRSVGVFTGNFQWIGVLAPVAQATAVLAVMWYLCYWLYRRKIFFKL